MLNQYESYGRMDDQTALDDAFAYEYRIGVHLGRLETLHKFLDRQATRKFGNATAIQVRSLYTVNDLERLRRMADRIFHATSWDDLLATS